MARVGLWVEGIRLDCKDESEEEHSRQREESVQTVRGRSTWFSRSGPLPILVGPPYQSPFPSLDLSFAL